MRPQKLTLKNFMPFRAGSDEVHEVDFSNLDLFAITGPMASGKSSIIDAIVWCLYGRTARYGADSKGVISAGETLCEVAFDFTVGNRWFRAVRRTGKTTESGLSEREGEEWIQDESGSDRLTARVEQLLGLDFDSFTKTVILPQGKYAEFLSSKPGDRRELLASILELGVYARVSERAREVAGQTKARAEALRETLVPYASVSRERVAQQRQELTHLEQQLTETTQREEIFQALMQKVNVLSERARRQIELQTEEQIRTDDCSAAMQRLSATQTQLQTLKETLSQLVADRDALGYDATRHDMLRRAVGHLREYQAAQQEVDRHQQALVTIQNEIQTLSQQLATQEQQVATVQQRQQDSVARLQTEITQSGDIATLTEKLAQAKRWKELQAEQRQLAEQHQQHTAKLTQIKNSLVVRAEQEEKKEQELRSLQQQRERLREEEQEKARLEVEAGTLGKELKDAAQEEKRLAKDCEDARAAVQAAEQELQKQQHALALTEQHEHEALHMLEETRRRYEVEHLRASLHVGDACPVCERTIAQVPKVSELAMGDLAVLQQAVESAKTATNKARQTWQKATATVAAATTRKETVDREFAVREQKRREVQGQFVNRFPGFSSLGAALSSFQQQRQELASTVKATDTQVQAMEKDKQTLARQREHEQREEATLHEAIRGSAAQLETNKGQLHTLSQQLAAFLDTKDDLEVVLSTRRQRLVQLEQEVKAAEQQHRQAEVALAALHTKKIQQEGNANVLASQRDAAMARTRRETQAVRDQLSLAADAVLPHLSDLERELTEFTQRQTQYVTFSQRESAVREEQERTDRAVTGLAADLQARKRALAETQTQLHQITEELTQARSALQTEVQAQGLTNIGEDGQGVREQLAAAHEHVIALRERRSRLIAEIAELERRCSEKEQEEEKLHTTETESRLATELHKLLGAEFTDFLSQGAVETLMRDASMHLQRLTHNRYSFAIEYKRRAIELQIIDHEDNRRARPTHSLSGGETFLASLAIALALSQGFRELATGKAARTSTECLILDEGFGTLDREGVQLVTETLQELRGEEGRMVGIITHVEEVAAAMPMRIEVKKGSRSSVIHVTG
jgi:DNA repair protein SbcC/Rad50